MAIYSYEFDSIKLEKYLCHGQGHSRSVVCYPSQMIGPVCVCDVCVRVCIHVCMHACMYAYRVYICVYSFKG